MLLTILCALYIVVSGGVFAYIVNDGSIVDYDEMGTAVMLAFLWPLTVPIALVGTFILLLVDKFR